MKYYSCIIFLICLFYRQPASAQTVNGNWYGVGKLQLSGSHEDYLSELILQQKNREVKAILNYYFKDSLLTDTIKGSFDVAARKLILQKFPIIYYQSPSARNSVDCYMSGTFILRVSKTESVLNGSFTGDDVYKYSAPAINFNFKKSIDTAALVLKEDKDDEPDTTKKSSLLIIHDTITQKQFSERKNIIAKELTINASVVQIELYDNGAIDNDSISVFFNQQLVLQKKMLTHDAIKLNLPINDSLPFNEISMFAENVGLIPPNTAVLILYDGETRYEIQMSSDFDKTATIRLKRKKN